MKLSKFLAIALFLSPVPVFMLMSGSDDNVDNNNKMSVSDSRHQVSLHVPDGWKWDTESGKEESIEARVYPESASADDTAIEMYVNVIENKEISTLDSFIIADLEQFRKLHDDLKVQELDSMETLNNLAKVRRISTEKDSIYETVAYVKEPQGFVVMVMTADSRELLDAYGEEFRKFVKSYEFGAVKVEKQKDSGNKAAE